MDIAKDMSRYSRADLLAMRYEGSSRHRPSCVNRIDLQNLNFWKINVLQGSNNSSGSINISSNNNNNNSNNYGSKSGISPDRENLSLVNANSLLSSRRALRNRERAHNYYQRFTSGDQIGGEEAATGNGATNPNYKTTSNIDHRSISSAHLMPAFAKRKIGLGTSTDKNEMQTDKIKDNATPADADLKSKIRANSMGSPMRRNEWEKLTSNNSPGNDHTSLSPTCLSGGRPGIQERRIGSGRLLPRNDNWEYKNQDSNADNNDRPSQNGNGNNSNTNTNINQRQRTLSAKHSERSKDNQGERRNVEKLVSGTAGAGRRSTNKDKLYFGDSMLYHNRGKPRNAYQHQERHEPEWFSAGPTSQLETIDLHGFDDPKDDSSNEFEDGMESMQPETSTSRRSSINSQQDSKEQKPATSHAALEFNFDAFLNMDPMDHTLMSNDSKLPGDISGTSRFSRWFAPKETPNNEILFLEETTMPESQEMPSVKDLEAQMARVDLRPDVQQTMHSEQVDKPATRDTEAFKRLLQQLGSQNVPPVNDSYQQEHQTPQRAHVPLPNMLRSQELPPQQQQQQRQKQKSEQIHKNLKMQYFKESQAIIGVHESNMFELMQAQKRLEIQQLQQSIVRGDVSLEYLEKEINNVSAHRREIISAVLYEFSNTGKNTAAQQKLTHANDLNQHNVLKNQRMVNKNLAKDMLPQNSASQGFNQHVNNSPTPLAFTPTSVLRKMTADKETQQQQLQQQQQQQQQQQLLQQNATHINNQQYQHYQFSNHHAKHIVHNMLNETPVMPAINLQPRMILGGNYAMQQHQLNANSPQISPKLLPQVTQSRNQQGKWPPGNMPHSSHGVKSFGRPILKGSLSTGAQQIPTSGFSSPNDLQQIIQQRFKTIQPAETLNAESIHAVPPNIQHVPYNDGISQMQHLHYLQQQQRVQQNRHRLLHADMHNQAVAPDVNDPAANLLKNNNLGLMNYHRDDRLSPTTNQLAQWFSPELLARASAGKLPLLNMNQALSLEEFERSMQHSSATVLN